MVQIVSYTLDERTIILRSLSVAQHFFIETLAFRSFFVLQESILLVNGSTFGRSVIF